MPKSILATVLPFFKKRNNFNDFIFVSLDETALLKLGVLIKFFIMMSLLFSG